MNAASGYPSAPPAQYSSAPVPASASGPSGAPPSIHPSRLAALAARDAGEDESAGGASPVPPPPQQTRPREEDESEAGPDAKRTKVEKLADGMYHPVSSFILAIPSLLFGRLTCSIVCPLFQEADWIAAHPYPAAINIQLPSNVAGKPELDGSLYVLRFLSSRHIPTLCSFNLHVPPSSITLPPLGLRTTIGELRSKIQEATKTSVPLSKMRLDLEGGKVLNNKSTLAELNLAAGDTLLLAVKK